MRDTAIRHRRTALRGVQNPRAKLTDDAVRFIRESDATLQVLADQFGVDQSLISLVRLRKIWKHVA